ncbi:hypothetical protein GRS96_00645 [Rathayibacter sp. VKM Ac-2803]|uniref:hypothetical protein n=1 Tax=unclassified Rathayibacter TaxID=2609250 RepID=UPI00135C2CC7|nr:MULTISPECIES: hypothetical protein [unclassified Rathayibacter]MWV47780.1 hypothetical protein [Rathayibacter sp. VKM Ac-2803]MWV59009.1 hypothetical protein [Rathayibacter sp. VKM Ac-2754]
MTDLSKNETAGETAESSAAVSGLTPEQATQVDVAEYELRRLGLAEVRVLHHGDLAIIAAPARDLSLIANSPLRGEVLRAVGAAGFDRVALDLSGRV